MVATMPARTSSLSQLASQIENKVPNTVPSVAVIAGQVKIMEISKRFTAHQLDITDAITEVTIEMLDMPICSNMTNEQMGNLALAAIRFNDTAIEVPARQILKDAEHKEQVLAQEQAAANAVKLSNTTQQGLNATMAKGGKGVQKDQPEKGQAPGTGSKYVPGDKPKKTCPIGRKQFLDSGQSLILGVGTDPKHLEFVTAEPREFSSGSVGYYFTTKVTILIDGVPTDFQIGCNATAIGSKEV